MKQLSVGWRTTGDDSGEAGDGADVDDNDDDNSERGQNGDCDEDRIKLSSLGCRRTVLLSFLRHCSGCRRRRDCG